MAEKTKSNTDSLSTTSSLEPGKLSLPSKLKYNLQFHEQPTQQGEKLKVPVSTGDPIKSVLSKYDLPIQFHEQSIQQWEKLKGSHVSIIPYDVEQRLMRHGIENEELRKSKFEFLEPDILIQRLLMQPNFSFMRTVAIDKLECDVIKQLSIMYDNHTCQFKELTGFEMPNRIFSWTMADFLERRKVQNMLWVEVLQREITPTCLEELKFKIDMEELMNLLKLIFKGVRDEDPSFDIYEEVIKVIDDVHDFLEIYERLQEELEQNQMKLRKDINESLALRFTKFNEEQIAQRAMLEEQVMNHHIWGPIELRYQMRYYRSVVTQFDYRCETEEKNLKQETSATSMKSAKENYSSDCCKNMYYTIIDNYKRKIEELSQSYDVKIEALDNDISYKKTLLDKLRINRKHLSEEIQRFHAEAERMRLKDIEDQLREELRLRKLMLAADLKRKSRAKKPKIKIKK